MPPVKSDTSLVTRLRLFFKTRVSGYLTRDGRWVDLHFDKRPMGKLSLAHPRTAGPAEPAAAVTPAPQDRSQLNLLSVLDLPTRKRVLIKKPAEDSARTESNIPVSQEEEATAEEPEAHGMDYSRSWKQIEKAMPAFGAQEAWTPTQRKKANEAAGEILSRCDLTTGKNNRPLTSDEKRKTLDRLVKSDRVPKNWRAKLAAYSGQGGIGDSLNEYYTPPVVAAAMWNLLARLGLKTGHVFEPCAGTGVFQETKPQGVTMTATEWDAKSSTINGLLHPEDEVINSALEDFVTVDSTKYDAVIGNVPFGVRGAIAVSDKPDLPTAEQYFVDTALDKAKDGGVVSLIVPHGIATNQTTRAFRKRVMAKAEILAVQRMPNTAFAHSGTGVVTDILVLRKRPQEVAGALGILDKKDLAALGVWDADWMDAKILDDPTRGMLHGTAQKNWRGGMDVGGSMEGVAARIAQTPMNPASSTLTLDAIQEHLKDRPDLLKKVNWAAKRNPYPELAMGTTRLINGILYILQGEPRRWHRADEIGPGVQYASDSKESQALELGKRLKYMADGYASGSEFSQKDIGALRADVTAYVEAHGNPGGDRVLAEMAARDPRFYPLLVAVDEKGQPSPLLRGEMGGKNLPVVNMQDFDVVLGIMLNGEDRHVTVEDIEMNWTGGSGSAEDNRPEILKKLYGSDRYAVSLDGSQWGSKDDLLSGDLYPKRDAMASTIATLSADSPVRHKLEEQVAWLDETLAPKTLEEFEISVRSGWMPLDILGEYLTSKAYAHTGDNQRDVRYVVDFKDGVYTFTNVGKGRAYLNSIYDEYLNRLPMRKEDWGKLKDMEKDFQTWIATSPHRATVEDLYNRLYNGYRPKRYGTQQVPLPGWNPERALNGYQHPALHWAMEEGKGITSYDVGVGKTPFAIALVKALKSQGKAKRPIIVLPKSLTANWAAEIEAFAPGSSVMIIGETHSRDKDGKLKARADSPEDRHKKWHQLMQGSYDYVLVTAPAYAEIDVDPITKGEYIKQDFWVKRSKKLEKATPRHVREIQERYDQAMANKDFQKRTDVIYWNDLGIDCLIADEAHCFPAGTLVDGKPIESLQVGDVIRSFSHARGKVEDRSVTDIQRRRPRSIVTVHLADGRDIVCTGNHPFFTQRGYVQACKLTSSDIVYCNDTKEFTSHKRYVFPLRKAVYSKSISDKSNEKEERLLRTFMQLEVKTPQSGLQISSTEVSVKKEDRRIARCRTRNASMLPVPCSFYAEQDSGLEEAQRHDHYVLLRKVLFGEMASHCASMAGKPSSNQRETVGGLPQGVSGAHVGQESHAGPHQQREDANDAHCQTMAADCAGRQWERTDRAAEPISVRAWVGDGGLRGWSSEKKWSLLDLQNRHWQYRPENRHRSRWADAPKPPSTADRQAQGEDLRSVRVDHLEIHQQTSDGTFGGMCPDGLVYNIEVDANHNYFVADILVHNCYKNLFDAHDRFGEKPKFLGGSGFAKRALDMQHKSKWVREHNANRGTFFLTATPTKNSPLEIYSMLSHIAPELFEQRGIRNQEDFIDRYCEIESRQILNSLGGIESMPVVSGFKNMNELRTIMGRYIYRKTASDVGLVIPEKDEHHHYVTMTPEQEQVYSDLRALAADNKAKESGEAHIFSIMDKMAKASMDLSLLDPVKYAASESPKYASMVKHVKEGLEDGGQIIFADQVDVHQKLKAQLVKAGIPEAQIGIINAQVCKDSAKRQNVADDYLAGKIKVVIGNTATMGEGVNLQKYTTDIHHGDQPWEPASIQQRNGRGIRQGNKLKSVRVHNYFSKKSFDGYRYQTVAGKRDWSDQLWHGADRLENLSAKGLNIGRDDFMIMMADDPDKARLELSKNKDIQLEKYKAVKQSEAIGKFRMLTNLKRNHAALDNKETKTAHMLDYRIQRMRDDLKSDEHFPHKALLNDATPSLMAANGLPIYTGGVYEMSQGDDAPAKVGKHHTWRVLSIDIDAQEVTMRPMGHISVNHYGNDDYTCKVEDLASGMKIGKPMTQHEELKTAIASMRHPAGLVAYPEALVSDMEPAIQHRLRTLMAAPRSEDDALPYEDRRKEMWTINARGSISKVFPGNMVDEESTNFILPTSRYIPDVVEKAYEEKKDQDRYGSGRRKSSSGSSYYRNALSEIVGWEKCSSLVQAYGTQREDARKAGTVFTVKDFKPQAVLSKARMTLVFKGASHD